MTSWETIAVASTTKNMRILWVNCRLLHPLNGGDRIRTYNMLRQIKRRNHVTYLCFQTPEDSPEAVTRAKEFCDELITVAYKPVVNGTAKFFAGVLLNSIAGDVPFFAKKYHSSEMTSHIRKLSASGKIDLIVVDYLASMIQLAGLNGDLKTPVMIFQHNVESQIWKRHSETDASALKRAVFRKQWRLTQDWERDCANRVAGQVTVSEDDTKFFREQLAMKNVLGAVPTGVDTEYFAQSGKEKAQQSLVFLGAMDWMPNIDAVTWFVQEIFPAVRQKFRKAHLTIVGRNPADRVKELASLRGQITVTGTVDDVRPYLHEAEAMIVPLRVGGGTRIKIYEGMATGIPVVSTKIGAEGLAVKHGENILLAESAADFAKAICDLFENNDLRKRIGASGLEMVRRDCSWDSITQVFEKYCRQITKGNVA